jgi:hypothetical protein
MVGSMSGVPDCTEHSLKADLGWGVALHGKGRVLADFVENSLAYQCNAIFESVMRAV